MYPTMRRLSIGLICASAISLASSVFAQNYPSQTVKVVVGFPPGGTTDVIARHVAQELGTQTGKTFVVENRGGASGTIATGGVAKATPDGHTLLVVSSAHGTAGALYASLPYTDADLTVVGMVASTPYVFVVHPSVAVNNFAELIRLLKQHPGKYEFASSSPGTAQHLGGELVKRMAGVNIVHVPYKGSGALMPDLLAGRVPMMFENTAIMMPHVRKGALKPLAVSSAKRTSLLPDLPTVAETGMGLEGFEVLGWFAVLVPARTPADVIKTLNTELNRMTTKPAVLTRLQELGAEPMGGTPEQAASYVRDEQEKWGRVIRDAGIKAN